MTGPFPIKQSRKIYDTNIGGFLHRYLDSIERAVSNGDCVLIENMGENMDPVLDALVGRNTIKKGRCVL